MPTCPSISVEDLNDSIRNEAHDDVVRLVKLWEEMGLSDTEVKERVRKVASKVRKVTQSMVTCDTENRDKLKRRCKEQQVQLDALCKEFMTVGIMVEGNVPALASLVDQNKYLHGKLIELEMEKEKHMVQVRTMLSQEGCLAKTLGKKSLEVSSRRLPDVATMERLKKQVEKLTHLKEEREQEMFAIKEDVIHNLEVLDLDLNTTSIEDMLIVDQEQFDSLRSEDIEGARKTLDGLRQRVEERKEEVAILLKKVRALYDRLAVTQERQSRLCIPEAFSLEELCKVDKVAAIKEELAKLQAMKMENMAENLELVKKKVEECWRCRMVGPRTQETFWRNSLGDPEEELKRIEKEVEDVSEDLYNHEETLSKVSVFLERCRLAKDLRIRQQDPARLKNRGNALAQEEKDRKKVNALPILKEELLNRAQKWGDFAILDRRLSELVAGECSILEQIYENSLSTSSTRPTSKSSRAMSRTAAAVPSSSRPYTRSNSTLGLRSTSNLSKGGTPSSSSMKAPSSSKVFGTRNRTRMMGGESPLTSRNPPPSLFVQDASVVLPEASLLLSESSFKESVPLSSTIQEPPAADGRTTKKVWNDRARVELMADQVQADQARLERSTASLRRAQEAAELRRAQDLADSSRHPQLQVSKRKLRRSNSCSDLRANQRKVGRLGASRDNRDMSALVEEHTGARERSRPVSSQRLVRAASSSKLFVR